MPGGDRRGPLGYGPMTGRGMGFCAGYDRGGFAGYGQGRGFGMRGGGPGFHRGNFGRYGRGRGYRNRFFNAAPAMPYGDWGYREVFELTPEREMDMLKNEAKAIQEELDFIQARIKDLENISQGNKEG